MTWNIDVAIFVGFLIVNLMVGLFYGRGVKTIKDYALGGRNFATGAIVSTIVASWVSGSGFFITLSKTYSDGLLYFIASLGMVVSVGIVALVFVPRMQSFLGFSSIAEVIGNIYGPSTRAIIAFGGIIASIGGIAVQFKVFGTIFNYFLGIEGSIAICLAGIIITIYSAFGGIRSVTFTDVLQFITFGFALPLVGILIWNKVHHDGFNFQTALNSPLFNYKELLSFGNPQFLQTIPLILYFSIPQMGQIEFQRISIGRNIEQVKKAFLIAGAILIFIKLVESWIPFLMYNLNPNLDPNHLLSYIIDNYTYPGLKGMFMIGIIAMTMSCADTDMNAASVFFGNDVCRVFNIGFKRELLMSRIFAICLGSGAIFLALSKNDLLSIVLAANSFYMPVATVPCMLTILGFRTTTLSILIGMGAGLVTVITWNILDIEMDCIVFGMLANLIFLIGSHYLLRQPGGWAAVRDTKYNKDLKNQRNKRFIKFINLITNFNFIEFCKRNSPTGDLTYMGLGIYCIIYTLTTMYSTHIALLNDNNRIVLIFYQIMMCTGTILAMYPIWPPRIKHKIIVQVAWNIVIFYMLVVFSFFFVMLNDFGPLQFAIFTVNIIITAILVGWKLALVMVFFGFYLSAQLYKSSIGINSLNFAIGSPQFIFMYSLMLVGSVLVIFLKPKQEYQILTDEKNEHLSDRIGSQEKQLREALSLRSEFIRNVQHEYHAPMTGITSFAETLDQAYDKLTEKQRKESIKIILSSSRRLDAFDSNISSLSVLSKAGYELNLEKIDFSELLYARISTCRKLYEENKEAREFDINIGRNITFNGDRKYLIQLLDNLIINAITYCKEGKITVNLGQFDGYISLTIIDEGIGIPNDELENIFEDFMVSSKTRTIAGNRGVGLALCKRVVEVHGGSIKAESNGVKGATFIVQLPL